MRHPRPGPLRLLGLLTAAVATGAVLWAAASPPVTATVAPDSPGRPTHGQGGWR
jgi:hypothetical protein